MAVNPDYPHFWIRLLCREEELPRLLDVYAFLHDFNLLYEISRAATDPNYASFEFSNLVFGRKEGLLTILRDEDRLRLQRMTKESPMELITLVAAVPAAVGAIWGVVQIVEKNCQFPLEPQETSGRS